MNVKHLFLDWKSVEKALKDKFVYLFLDYDGTLAPVAESPEEAVMPKRTKALLRQLSKRPDCGIAIVSGRALKDISRRIGLKNAVYVGNHGFEIEGPEIDFKSPVPVRYGRTLKEIGAKLQKRLSPFKGVLIEDKGPSLSVHYRLVNKSRLSALKTGFRAVLSPYELRNDVRVRTGKMIFEIMPPSPWNKGRAVSWLLNRRVSAAGNRKTKVLPVYIGDDATDEDAFKYLKKKGITIFTGRPGKTKARFYLKNPGEISRFLGAILKNRKRRLYGGR